MTRRKSRIAEPLPGLYKNGRLWWIRTVTSPLTGEKKALSSGTDDTARANAVLTMVRDMEESRPQWEWLRDVLSGGVTLDVLYTHHAAGTLTTLREEIQKRIAEAADSDLMPVVRRWVKEHLAAMDIRERTKDAYAKQVRFFIPDGEPFPKSRLTEDYIKDRLSMLTARGEKASGGTRRRYLVPLAMFIRYAKKRVGITDPLEDADWLPSNGSPRMKTHTFAEIQDVLSRVTDAEQRAALALVYGSGIELGALLDMTGVHVKGEQADGRGLIVAPGSKNEAREERTIYVDAWAWKTFYPHARMKIGRARLWSAPPPKPGKPADWKALRAAYYWAQHHAGLIDAPPKSKATGKYLWRLVDPHHLHDARHTYVEIRSLGLDGEPAQDITFCSHQLGHADETMVMRVYKKKNIKERQRAIQLQQVQQAAKAAGGEK